MVGFLSMDMYGLSKLGNPGSIENLCGKEQTPTLRAERAYLFLLYMGVTGESLGQREEMLFSDIRNLSCAIRMGPCIYRGRKAHPPPNREVEPGSWKSKQVPTKTP